MRRVFSLVLLFGLLATAAPAQELLKQRVSLHVQDVLLEEALYALMDNYGLPLSFSNDILPPQIVSAHLQDRPVEGVLDFLLRNTSVSFRQVGRQIVLYRTDYRAPGPTLFTISGYVEDSESGERLIAAGVFDRRSGRGTQSNEYGFFSLSLPPGEVELHYSYLGYTPEVQTFTLMEHRQLTVGLHTSLVLAEVLVLAADTGRGLPADLYSLSRITRDDAEGLPLLAGEPDVVRVTHLLAGVQTGADGVGGLSVRGGDAGHNLVLLDGVPVYNVSHGAGLFSIFNTEAVKSVQFIKGSFPARYGGRLASVLDVRTRDGHRREFHGQAGLGLLAARATLEGPIVRDKSSFLVSGRWSFLDWYLKPLASRSKGQLGEKGSTAYRFYDLTAKLNWTLTARDKVFFSFYSGGDAFLNYGRTDRSLMLAGPPGEDSTRLRFQSGYRQQLDWGNQVAALRWNHVFSPRLFANSTFTFSRLLVDVHFKQRDSLLQENPLHLLGRTLNVARYHSGIIDMGARIDFDFIPSPQHFLRFGGGLTHYRINPGLTQYDEETQELIANPGLYDEVVPATELALFAEDDIQLSDDVHINAGLRTAALVVEGRSYVSLEPRFAFAWALHPEWTLRGAASIHRQFLHLLSSANLALPIDLWVPSTRDVEPEQARQLSLGVDHRLSPRFDLTFEGYYKQMDQLVTYQDGAFFLDDWRQSITTGEGRAYGLETTLRKSSGRTTGWIAYSLAWTDRRFDAINAGRPYPFRYDRRHDLKVVLHHRATDWLDLTADWVFGTGLAFSFPLYAYDLPYPNLPLDDRQVLLYNGKNNFRLPPYHRLDLGLRATFRSRSLEHLLSLGVYNTYYRQNPLYYDLRTTIDTDGRRLVRNVELAQVNVIPLLPYLNYSVKF